MERPNDLTQDHLVGLEQAMNEPELSFEPEMAKREYELIEYILHLEKIWRTLKGESGYRKTIDITGNNNFTLREIMEEIEKRAREVK